MLFRTQMIEYHGGRWKIDFFFKSLYLFSGIFIYPNWFLKYLNDIYAIWIPHHDWYSVQS